MSCTITSKGPGLVVPLRYVLTKWALSTSSCFTIVALLTEMRKYARLYIPTVLHVAQPASPTSWTVQNVPVIKPLIQAVYIDDGGCGGTSISSFVNSTECSINKCIEHFFRTASIMLENICMRVFVSFKTWWGLWVVFSSGRSGERCGLLSFRTCHSYWRHFGRIDGAFFRLKLLATVVLYHFGYNQ